MNQGLLVIIRVGAFCVVGVHLEEGLGRVEVGGVVLVLQLFGALLELLLNLVLLVNVGLVSIGGRLDLSHFREDVAV